MYSVSDEYIEALRRPVKYDRITGQIRLADGTRIEINNNVIVQGRLSITRSVCGSSFDIGAFNAARMSITIKDEAAYDHEFGNATISLYYGLLTDIENDMWEDVPLGVFYVDGHYTTRSGGTVSLQAFDSAGKFEVEPPKLDGVTTLYGALQQACLKANVGLAITESELNAFPNAAIVPSFTNARIQSCRDIVIWVAQAAGASAFIDRNNMLTLKRYYYAGGDVYDRLFTANERNKIKFTDTRTYFAYLSNYCAGEPKMYSNILSFTGADAPHVKEGGLTLPENPLLLALTAEEQDAANMALMENYSAPTRYIKATGTTDPAIDPLDVVAFKDGSIDIGQIISVCTKIQWKYRGSGYVECNNFDEYSVDNSVSAVALADTETQTDTNYARTPPKSQTQKQIDELKAGMSGGGSSSGAALTEYEYISDSSVKYNGMTYSVEKNDNGLISKISDSNGNEFEPTISGEISDVALHNAVFWALAMHSGIRQSLSDDTLTPMVQYRYGADKHEIDNTTVRLFNQASGGDIRLIFANASLNNGNVYVDGNISSYGYLNYTAPQGELSDCTIYLVAHGVNAIASYFFCAHSSYASGYGDTAAIRAKNGYWAITPDLNLDGSLVGDISSTDKTVIAVKQTDSAMHLYLNGRYIGVCSKTAFPITAGAFLFGKTNGGYNTSTGYHYYDFAFAESAHSDKDIIRNSKYLMYKYGVK